MILDATTAINLISAPLQGYPAFLAGSAVAAQQYVKLDAWSDIDVFCPSEQAMFINAQRLLDSGFEFAPRHDRVWARWIQYGFKKWHTNSLRMVEPNTGTQVNLVYKLIEGHPATSLAQVVESFDFGLLAVGYDLQRGTKHDFRSALFPGFYQRNGALPMMPNKRDNWRAGYISQYVGLREAARYVKYLAYGYDLKLVKDDLVEGYLNAAAYLTQRDSDDKKLLGQIYETFAFKISADDTQAITDASALLVTTDALDAIMDALE